MKLFKKTYQTIPNVSHRELRCVSGFLWSPTHLNGKWKWLVFASWLERFNRTFFHVSCGDGYLTESWVTQQEWDIIKLEFQMSQHVEKKQYPKWPGTVL